jgi:ribosomal protein S18 acetylase RimI-like enzyme
VGFVAIGYVNEAATRAGEIHMLAVDPDHQRAGVGASLVRRAVTEIKSRGVDLAVIATGADTGHTPARALYDKLNFTALHQVRYYRKL